MTSLQQLEDLPAPQRRVAKRILLQKMLERFDENRHVSEATMRYALGFTRADLVSWYAQARAAADAAPP
jgi:hypothetical protein